MSCRAVRPQTRKLICLALLPICAQMGSNASGRNVPVFVSGTPAPGGIGSLGSVTSASSIALGNEVTATMRINDPSANIFGILRGSETGSVLIARTGINYGTGVLVEVANGAINSTGAMSLAIEPSAKPYGVYRAGDSSVSPVAISTIAQPVATAPGGGTFSFVDSSVITAGGTIAFHGTLSNSAGEGIWRNNTDGSTIRIAASGVNNVPGVGSPTFGTFGLPAINEFGYVAFSATIPSSGQGIFLSGSGTPSDLSQIVQSGMTAPGGTATFIAKFSNPTNSNRRKVAFYDTLSDGNAGIWFGGPDSFSAITQIAITGGNSGGGTFNSFSPPVGTPSGYVAFAGYENPTGGGIARQGIWRTPQNASGILRIAGYGDNPVGTGTITILSEPAVSDGGQVAYKAKIGTGTGLLISDGTMTLQAIATGSALLGSTVTDVSSNFSADHGGHSIINKYGQLAYQATLADGRQAVMLYTPDLHWQSANGGNFGDYFNWTLSLAPAGVHDVFVDPANAVTINASGGNVHSLTIGGNATTVFNNVGSTSHPPFVITGALTVNATGTTSWSNSPITAGSVVNNGSITVQTDSLTTGAITGAGGYLGIGTAATGATLTADSIRQKTLFINAASHVVVRPIGSTSVLNTLSMNGGSLDLGNNSLIVDYTTTSPLTSISGNIIKGYNGGAWNGPWITTSSTTTGGKFGLGYAESSAVLGPTGGSFAGQNVDATALLVKYTLYGDANLDGAVNALDFNALASNFGVTTNRWWYRGNFNYDTVINTLDFNILAGNFNSSMPAPLAPLGSVVPEPHMLVSAAIASMLLPRRLRRCAGRRNG